VSTSADTPHLDLLVVGSGVAGLSAAVRAAEHGLSVGVLTKGMLEQATTRWAQGGIAAVVGGDPGLCGHPPGRHAGGRRGAV